MSIVSKLLRWLGLGQAPADSGNQHLPNSPMNEGDFHSGPGGYSPGAGYPDSFYGSGQYLFGDSNDEGDYSAGSEEGGYR
jgi:hypothetical protein